MTLHVGPQHVQIVEWKKGGNTRFAVKPQHSDLWRIQMRSDESLRIFCWLAYADKKWASSVHKAFSKNTSSSDQYMCQGTDSRIQKYRWNHLQEDAEGSWDDMLQPKMQSLYFMHRRRHLKIFVTFQQLAMFNDDSASCSLRSDSTFPICSSENEGGHFVDNHRRSRTFKFVDQRVTFEKLQGSLSNSLTWIFWERHQQNFRSEKMSERQHVSQRHWIFALSMKWTEHLSAVSHDLSKA